MGLCDLSLAFRARRALLFPRRRRLSVPGIMDGMSAARRVACLGLLLLVPLFVVLPADPTNSVTVGVVVDRAGPIAGARVRWQGDSRVTLTDVRGRFRLAHGEPGGRRLTATKPGYLIGYAATNRAPFRIELKPWPTTDDPAYDWVDPHPDAGSPMNCGNCHAAIHREWAESAHARSARNPKFLALFDGDGGVGTSRATWNVTAEHPLGAGVCASCHAPTLAAPDLDYNVRRAEGVAARGIHCDFCHKVADVPTDLLGTRFGRDGMSLLRASGGARVSFGPLEDAVRPGESFAHAPLYRESRYCASCHEGVVFGVHAYSTYSEWRDSPAAKRGVQCQDCHMAPTGTLRNMAPGKGGVARDPHTLASHRLPGGQVEMLRRSLHAQVRAARAGNGVTVVVELRAQGVGHRVPTGFPERHLILVVEAIDARGAAVAPIDGPRLPSSTGAWSGRAGWLYARQFVGFDGRSPVPFWRPIERVTDTRLRPEQPDRRRFTFGAATRRVRVRLWYRRFWDVVARSRGWSDNDHTILEQVVDCGEGPAGASAD